MTHVEHIRTRQRGGGGRQQTPKEAGEVCRGHAGRGVHVRVRAGVDFSSKKARVERMTQEARTHIYIYIYLPIYKHRESVGNGASTSKGETTRNT